MSVRKQLVTRAICCDAAKSSKARPTLETIVLQEQQQAARVTSDLTRDSHPLSYQAERGHAIASVFRISRVDLTVLEKNS